MNRRDTLLALALLATRPAIAHTRRVPRIGLLPEAGDKWRQLITEALLEQGWAEKRDYLLVELGLQYGKVQPTVAAKRMKAANPDLLLTVNSSFALAAHRESQSIPIVMMLCGYPVDIGLANSLATPGKNATGTSIYAGTGIWGKLLQLLQESKPSIKRIGMLYDYVPPDNPIEESKALFDEMSRAARQLGLALQMVQVPTPDRLEPALAQMDAAQPDALLVTSGAAIHTTKARTIQFAIERRLPTITDFRWFSDVDPYPMLVYAADTPSLVRQAAGYAVRILRDGVKASDLPIQQPAKFEMVVNRKNARAIGLALPQSLLLRADHVID